MIRAPAALEVARDIMSPFMAELELTDEFVALAASMIMKACEADELRQKIEELETTGR